MSLTPEQAERRKHGVGCSEVAKALGLSKWGTPLDLYREKRGEAEPSVEEKREWRYGHVVEPFILGEFELEKNVTLIRSPDTMKRGDLIGHLDGLLPGQYPVQAKSARRREGWGEPGTDEMPIDYWLQSQAEMLLTGLRVAYVPVLFFGSQFAIYENHANPEVQARIEAGVAEFMDRVRRGHAPPPVSLKEVNAFYQQSMPQAVRLSDDAAKAADDLSAAKASIKLMEERAAELEAQVKSSMGDFEVAMRDGQVVATWKKSKDSEKFDHKRFLNDHPEFRNAYTYFQPGSRRFLLKV